MEALGAPDVGAQKASLLQKWVRWPHLLLWPTQVTFFGYDPDVDSDLDLKTWTERPFTSFNLKPMESGLKASGKGPTLRTT